jgi:hypothetical protein
MSDLSLRETNYETSRYAWLASAFGTERRFTGSLDVSLFTEADHFADGFIPAGMVLGPVTATPGLYGPYDDGAADGTEVAAGHLWHNVRIPVGTTTGERVVAIADHLIVVEANLPDVGATVNGGIDAAAKVDLVHCQYV